MKIKLSIVVPTKNRHYYLKYLVHYFKSINSKHIELIICDNSSIDLRQKFSTFLKKINDERIKYFEEDKEMSQTENCDLAVSKASGEYISLLGDDDIFSKHILNYIDQWSKDKVEVILPAKGVYIWPDVKPRLYGNNQSGKFKLGLGSNKIIRIEAKDSLRRVINLGGSEILNLPRIYHGIVNKQILNKIFKESGTYFPGPSPDIANAIALCKYVKNYIIIDSPLIISGQSILSAGGQGAEGNHYGEISQIKQLPKNTSKEWSDKVPFYWSGKTIYAESVLQALRKMGMNKYLQNFNYEYLYASCLVFDTNYKDKVFKCISSYKSFLKIFKIGYYYFLIWFKRLSFHLRYNLVLITPFFSNINEKIFVKQNILEVAVLNDQLLKAKKHHKLFKT